MKYNINDTIQYKFYCKPFKRIGKILRINDEEKPTYYFVEHLYKFKNKTLELEKLVNEKSIIKRIK